MNLSLLDIVIQQVPKYAAYLRPGADGDALRLFRGYFGLEQQHPLVQMLTQHNGQAPQISGGAILGGEYLSSQRIIDISNQIIEASTLLDFKNVQGEPLALTRNYIPFLSFGAAGVLAIVGREVNSPIVCIDFDLNLVSSIANTLESFKKILITGCNSKKITIEISQRDDITSFGLRYKGRDILFPEVVHLQLHEDFPL